MLFILVGQEKRFFAWVKEYWFFSRSKINKFASLFFYIGILLLTLSLADLRGKEEIIKGKVAQKKTLILIDSSSSMLAEDVRPNRYEKSLLLAKHYLKKAVGEQVSIVVFSDKQKRIVPFTTDMNLIEARLGTLEKLDLQNGGSNIALALSEAEKYFITQDGISIGNILLITDGEDNEDGFDIKLSDNITLATIGVGTAKGTTIPLRNSRGISRGVKRYNGKPVITQLDEGFLKSIGKNVKNYRYWVASSYTLPTEEIQAFFNRIYKSKMNEGEVRIKPVKYDVLLVPALILLIISGLLKLGKTFVYVCLVFSLNSLAQTAPVGGNLSKANGEKKEPEKSKEILRLEEKFASGDITETEKKYMAQKLLEEGFPKESSTLYNELLKDVNENNISEHLNKGVAEFEAGKVQDGISTYNKLLDYLEENDPNNEIVEKLKKNLFKALQQMEQQKSKQSNSDDKNQDDQNQSDQQDQQNQQNQNNQQNNQQNQNNNQNDQQDQNNQSNDNQNNKDQDNKKDDKKENQGKDKDDKKKDESDGDKDKDKKNNDGDKEKDKKENKGAQGNKKKELPALLKQLISDDNQLQKDAIDAQTKERKTRDKKDW